MDNFNDYYDEDSLDDDGDQVDDDFDDLDNFQNYHHCDKNDNFDNQVEYLPLLNQATESNCIDYNDSLSFVYIFMICAMLFVFLLIQNCQRNRQKFKQE